MHGSLQQPALAQRDPAPAAGEDEVVDEVDTDG